MSCDLTKLLCDNDRVYNYSTSKGIMVSRNVVKTGPDRPVRPVGPGTGHSTGPDRSCEPPDTGTAQKALKTALNRPEPVEPVNR
jgi:hypothetical protein